jgi:hypothetical protein
MSGILQALRTVCHPDRSAAQQAQWRDLLFAATFADQEIEWTSGLSTPPNDSLGESFRSARDDRYQDAGVPYFSPQLREVGRTGKCGAGALAREI